MKDTQRVEDQERKGLKMINISALAVAMFAQIPCLMRLLNVIQ